MKGIGMAHQDPRQEIINRLTRLFGLAPAVENTLETPVSFLRERCITGRQVHAVTFKNRSGETIYFICYLLQDEQGLWRFRGGAGGENERDREYAHLRHKRAWAHLSGGGWPLDFYAGGYLVDNDCQVVHVCLIASNGTRIEDRVESGIVLFLTAESVETPLQAELYSRTGKLVNSHDVF